jgi:hypothetical protein
MSPISGAIQHSFSDNIKPNEAWDLVHFSRNLRVSLQTPELATAQVWQRLHPEVLKPTGQDLPPSTGGN